LKAERKIMKSLRLGILSFQLSAFTLIPLLCLSGCARDYVVNNSAPVKVAASTTEKVCYAVGTAVAASVLTSLAVKEIKIR